MKRFIYFINRVLPNVTCVIPMDDGSLYVYSRNKRGGVTETIMPINDYETAVSIKQKVDGMLDRANNLC